MFIPTALLEVVVLEVVAEAEVVASPEELLYVARMLVVVIIFVAVKKP